jgi:hypothetical protein
VHHFVRVPYWRSSARLRDPGERLSRVTNDQHPAPARWRVALKSIAAGRLLGFMCLALAPVFTAAWLGFGWFIPLYAVVVAAAALNASTWLAAIFFGRTRHLRARWFSLLASLLVLWAAFEVWPDLTTDFAIVIGTTLIVLGFPSSMLFLITARQGPLPHLPWSLERAIPAAIMLGILVSAYLQPFVLLPLLFRWRLKPETAES